MHLWYGGDSQIDGRFLVDSLDVSISGLFEAGQTHPLVIPLMADIPADSQIYIYHKGVGWRIFGEDAHNLIHSTLSVHGVCPAAAHENWSLGFNRAHECLQLTLNDGGINDSDNTKDAIIQVIFALVQPSVSHLLATGDVAPLGAPDGRISVADALVLLRYALGLISPVTPQVLAMGDVAPLGVDGKPNPNGDITVADALIVLRKALGLVDF